MAYAVDIGGGGTLFVGEDKVLRFELVDTQDPPQPVEMSSFTMIFDVRKKDNSPDPAIVSAPVTVSGIFNANRLLNQQRGFVVLSDDMMNLFKAKTYRYSWKRMDTGVETVLMYGNFAPEKATAP